MRELLAPEMLEVWERGSVQSPTERALTLLHAARPDLDAATLAQMSIGRRDRLLLLLRASTFGRQLSSIANCPECGEELEMGFEVEQLQLPESSTRREKSHTTAIEDYELRFRLPDSRDLMSAATATDVDSAKRILIDHCVLSVQRHGTKVGIDQVDPRVVEQLEAEMARLDAQANIQLQLECPSCSHRWTAAFDILAFLWNELDAWAQRLLVEVHQLASAYGWREADIVSMSTTRRNLYLNLVNG